MTLLHPTRIFRDQFTRPANIGIGRRVPSLLQSLWVITAAAVGLALWVNNVSTIAVGALLTATSIMTGLTFTMAMRFWERRVDARSDPDIMFDLKRVDLLDAMSTHLLWTVIAGILCTAWLAGAALVSGTSVADWASGIAGGLFSYQLMLVLHGLVKLYSAATELT